MVIYIYSGILAIKKNKIMPSAATWMDLEIIILSEVNQTKKNIWYHLYMNVKNLIYKTETDSQTSKTNL